MRSAAAINAVPVYPSAPRAAAPAARAADVAVPREQVRTGVSSRGRVRKQDVADMTDQLAIMTKSGVDLASAIASLVAQCERPHLAEVLRDVNELVLCGNTLSEALRQHPSVFDAAYVATIAAAEASGKMSDVLQQLAEMQRSEMRLRRSIKSLLTYPVMLTCISGSVIAVLVTVVLPKFAEIFAQYNTPLPMVTKVLLAGSVELQSRWWLWGPLAAAAVAGAVAWRVTESGRRSFDSLMIYGAVIRNVTRPLLIGRTCQMLGLLLQSGVPLLEALQLCRHAVGNRVYKDLLAELAESVVNGRGMEPPLSRAEIVPMSAREMIVTAERTGNLSEVAAMLGEYYEDEAETRMRSAVRLLEPLITVGMGLIVAVVVLAVMLPIFDLSSFTQSGGH
ncbi:MAG TPA: type II secretion system F family protein [Lacipirellulaceae bacterium]|nr:type II secretion system F family protein [Lacipirellulaceae bacterium]